MTMAALRGVAEAERLRAAAATRCEATGLQDRLVQPIGTLSKGYRQRVGIAQAIIHRPDVLILDEPTNGLDPTQIAEIRTLIQRLAERTTVLLSTHILSEVEATCERVVVIMHGTLRADAKLADLRAANAAVIAVDKGAKGRRRHPAQARRRGRRGAGHRRWRLATLPGHRDQHQGAHAHAVRRGARARLAAGRAAARSQDARDRVPRPGGPAGWRQQGGGVVSAAATTTAPRGRSLVGAIVRKELRGFFSSAVALVFLGTFLTVVMFSFFWWGGFFARGVADVRPLFDKLPLLLILLVSALSMRVWSEEQRGGTIEILMTLPVSRVQLVLGKFIAGMLLVTLALLLTLASR
jgi:energy-coupling factor transporter ATP-binding protein EcfA2